MSADIIRVSVVYRKSRRRYFLQYRDPVSGNKVTRKAEGSTRRAAEREAAVWQDELNTGRAARTGGRMSWAEFRGLYEDEHVSGLAQASEDRVAAVFNILERLIKPRRLVDVNEAAISRYANLLRNSGRSEHTIKTHLAHIKSALRWAADQRLLVGVPRIRMPQRAKASRVMKGRPLTQEEFERMRAAVLPTMDRGRVRADRLPAIVSSWQHLLDGLWWSGLRLEEATVLHWTDRQYLCVEQLEGNTPMLWVPCQHEKGNQDRLLPIAPEFAEFLRKTPPRQRTGYVFSPKPRKETGSQRLTADRVGRVISDIGKASGIRVRDDEGKLKFASAHDLRRSFGDRWSRRVMPAVLKELMRHETVETTMRYYVGRDAEATAAAVWQAYRAMGEQVGDHAAE